MVSSYSHSLMSVFLFFYKREASPLTLTQHTHTKKHHHNSNSHNKHQLDLQSNCTHLASRCFPIAVYQIEDVLIIHYILHIPSQRWNTPRGVVWHMTYFANSSFCFFFVATNKSNHNTIDKTFSISHDTLIQLVASLIKSNPTFQPIQNKAILTTSGFHDVFAQIFHLITYAPP